MLSSSHTGKRHHYSLCSMLPQATRPEHPSTTLPLTMTHKPNNHCLSAPTYKQGEGMNFYQSFPTPSVSTWPSFKAVLLQYFGPTFVVCWTPAALGVACSSWLIRRAMDPRREDGCPVSTSCSYSSVS